MNAYKTIIKVQIAIICAAVWFLWLPLFPFLVWLHPEYETYLRIGYYIIIGAIYTYIIWAIADGIEKDWVVPEELSYIVDLMYPESEGKE